MYVSMYYRCVYVHVHTSILIHELENVFELSQAREDLCRDLSKQLNIFILQVWITTLHSTIILYVAR